MMRLLAWAAWACAEAAGVAFVERIVSAYAPNVAAIFAADANGDGRIEVWSAADGAYGLRSYEHNWRHDLPDEYDTYVLESGSAWVDVVAADFDGDGALEVAAATSAAVSWNEYEYLQWVGYSTPIVESMYVDTIAAIFAADVDGDADQVRLRRDPLPRPRLPPHHARHGLPELRPPLLLPVPPAGPLGLRVRLPPLLPERRRRGLRRLGALPPRHALRLPILPGLRAGRALPAVRRRLRRLPVQGAAAAAVPRGRRDLVARGQAEEGARRAHRLG